jgi:hypothetical protein
MTSIAGVQSPNIQGHPNFPYLIGGKQLTEAQMGCKYYPDTEEQ